MKRQRIVYLDMLRVVSMFFIVLIHVSSGKEWYQTSVNTISWWSLNFWDAVARWSVPVFVMISGALFLNPKYPINTHKLFHKNIKRIITAFIFWSIIYAIYDHIAHPNHTSISYYVGTLIHGHYHMWFLPMIVALYLIVPLLRLLTVNKKATKYFLILAIIFTAIIPTVIHTLMTLEKVLPSGVNFITYNLYLLNKNLYFSYVGGFTGYFVGGYYLSQLKTNKKTRSLVYLLGFAGLIYTIVSAGLISNALHKPTGMSYDYLSINVALTAIAVFIFFKELGRNMTADKHHNLIGISSLVFGIYLVHVLILHIFVDFLHLNMYILKPLFTVPIVSIVIFILSVLVALLIHQIPWLKTHIE